MCITTASIEFFISNDSLMTVNGNKNLATINVRNSKLILLRITKYFTL